LAFGDIKLQKQGLGEPTMSDAETREKILAAIKESTFKWRTPRGIAQSSGININDVMEYLNSEEVIIQSRNTNAKGEPLFTTAEKYRQTTGLGSRVLSAITNKVMG
jgi:23S rRNA maturation mini-RNase III